MNITSIIITSVVSGSFLFLWLFARNMIKYGGATTNVPFLYLLGTDYLTKD